jgi:hypothetical protein
VRRHLAAAVAAALLGAGPTARAAGEAEWQLSARLGPAGLNTNGNGPCFPGCAWGGVGALDLEYGLNDAWALRLSLGASLHPVDARPDLGAPGGTVNATSAMAGVTYTFDVLRLVPYVAGTVGAMRFDGAVAVPRTTLAGEISIGADYLITRFWAWGGSFQYRFTPGGLVSSSFSFDTPAYMFSATLRVSRIFF